MVYEKVARQPRPPSQPPPPLLYYHPLPSDDQPDYIILPVYFPAVIRRKRRSRVICCAAFLLLLLLVFVAIYLLWPSEPDLSIVRLRLESINFHTVPFISVDITLDLTVKVRNRDFYSIDYRSLVVGIGYRGKKLGFVTSDYGHVRARGTSYVEARLALEGVEILSDVIMLLEDLAKGSVPFNTITEVRGQLGLGFFELPLKGKVSCDIYVNTRNKTILRQNCYPE